MAKKSRRSTSVKKAAPHHVRGNVVHAGFEDTNWHPLEEQIDRNRDQSYMKKVKPRTDGQRALMEAIEQYNLTLAMGPAGSGKTYLAISAAVDALTAG
jgi:phosphate starvation-inducible PhoH-like protein